MFITYPLQTFLPRDIPRSKVAYMPASTDWLDALNKDIRQWDRNYYRGLYNKECVLSAMPQLTTKKYIIQITRFDVEDIDNTIKSYAEFYRMLEEQDTKSEVPQLVITGSSSINDPDSTMIYNKTINRLNTNYPYLRSHISIIRLDANDQLVNSLLSGSHVVLQLSAHQGFEINVSEALHKGKPFIATKTGGTLLQIKDNQNGFLVDSGDWNASARHLFDLSTNTGLYKKMSQFAQKSVSDDVGAVGNAMAWFYLIDKLGNGEAMVPAGRWVADLARNAAGKPYAEGEMILPRSI